MAFNAYIHIDTIEGESKDAEYTGETEVLQYDMSLSQAVDVSPSTSGSHTAGKANWTPFTFTKTVDAASPILVRYCHDGTHVDTVVLSINRAGTEKQKFLEYTFSNCLIQSVSMGASGGDGLPTETVSIRFGTYKQVYKPTSTLDGATMGSNVAMINLIDGKSS